MRDHARLRAIDYIHHKLLAAQTELARACSIAAQVNEEALERELNALDARLEALRCVIEGQLAREIASAVDEAYLEPGDVGG